MSVDIYFNPGMFGSTIEYMLRQFTNEFNTVNCDIAADGSMHRFVKEYHKKITEVDLIDDYEIGTIFYPHENSAIASRVIPTERKNIVILSRSFNEIELNLLFQYNKIMNGTIVKGGLDVMFGISVDTSTVAQWNPQANNWQDLERWQLRELISLFYPGQLMSLLDHGKSIRNNKSCNLSNLEILFDLRSGFVKIADYLGVTIINEKELDKFVVKWSRAQQYIVQQYQTVNEIVAQVVDFHPKKSSFWWKDLNIIQESMVQKKLRDHGYEIRCNDLNKFPVDIKTLYNLLEMC